MDGPKQSQETMAVGVPAGAKTSNSLCSINIWDKVGPQRFEMLRPELRLADGLIFSFDARNEASFENIKKWLNKAEDCAGDYVGRVIIGNNMTA